MRRLLQNFLRTAKPFTNRLHLVADSLAALFVFALILRRFRTADTIADVAALTLQGGKFRLGSLNIGLQVGNRVDVVFLQEVIVTNQLLQILFRRP